MPVISETPLKLFKSAKQSEKPENAEVIGTLPPWVRGSYLRIGPGFWDFGNEFSLRHWLDGYALLQKFIITQSSISFEKKFLESDAYKRSCAAKRPVINEFGTAAQRDPNQGFFSRIVSNLLPEFTDNNYATLFEISGDIFSSCDTCFFRKVNSQSLTSNEKFDGNKLFGLNGQSAHPLTDSNGDTYNVGFNLMPFAKYSFIKIPKGSNSRDRLKAAKVICSFSSRWTGCLSVNHSFGMTENGGGGDGGYLIYVEQPVTVSVSKIASSLLNGLTLKDVLEWRPQDRNRFVIVEKNTGKMIKTEFLSAESFYFMHIVNAFFNEANNEIVVDLISYRSTNMLDSLYMDKLRERKNNVNVDLSCIQRFVVPLIMDVKRVEEGVELLKKNGREGCSAVRRGLSVILEPTTITKRGLEMGTINKSFYGRDYRFVYAAGTFNESSYCHSITKTDLETGITIVWKESEFHFPGEPLFIKNPDGTEEEDGLLVSAVTDSRDNQEDYLLFLNPRDLTEVARAKFANHIPSGLHGLFLPN